LYEDHINELRQQRVKYDVHTTSKVKHRPTRHFLSHIIFIANLSAILIGTIFNAQQYNQTGVSWPTG